VSSRISALSPTSFLSLWKTLRARSTRFTDVGAWLRGLGLGEYEATFRENAIDDTVLPNLTAEDLKDLGVGIVGHRRKLLHAIAALHAGADEGDGVAGKSGDNDPSAPMNFSDE
jgi:SAM domain (Sterile alpha motif)